jgi:hypothetical protein
MTNPLKTRNQQLMKSNPLLKLRKTSLRIKKPLKKMIPIATTMRTLSMKMMISKLRKKKLR